MACWLKRQVRAVELFAGAGGAALGLHAAGIEHLRCIEWDKDAAATLAAAGFPTVCGDVRDLSLYAGLDPDLIWSSFPCQCWSSASPDRLGPKDTERNGWPWTMDAIDAMSPRWFVAENVTGLTQHRGECAGGCVGPELCPRAYLDRVILAQLRERFPSVACRVLNSSSYGVPQHRRRLIIVAGKHAIDWPAPTHGKPTGQGDLFGRSLLPWVTIGQALGLDGGMVVQSGVCYSDPGTHGKESSAKLPSPTLPGSSGMYVGESLAGSRPHRLDQPSPTVSAVGECKGSGEGGNPQKMQRASDALFLATGRRRLTVHECAALQDFPPDHPWQGNQQSQYRQVGNAVPPTLARVVAEAVLVAASEPA
ncbi:hypothetical protein CMI37_18340 [Candidatus Pacearchaeota archaeon]|nr:hypothetical protein [Candidatus Pacearchaeota archaeon]